MAPRTRYQSGKLATPKITIKNGKVEKRSPTQIELGIAAYRRNFRSVTRKLSKPRLYVRNGQVVRPFDTIDQLFTGLSMNEATENKVPALTNDSASPEPEVKMEQSDDDEAGMLYSIPDFDETKALDRYTFDGKPVKYENDC